jgi:hypothetical protein
MVLSIVAITPMSADPQYVFHPVSLPGVTLIEANTPEFLPLVTSLVDPAVLSSIQPVLPFSYVLKNTSNKFIIVYSTRWTLIDSAGNVTTQDRTWWNLSTLRDGDAIAPGASRLVSPIFRLGVSNAGPTGAALSRQIQRTLGAFTSKARVETSVETVIFEDGSAVGTDATNATAQAQAYLDAEREVVDNLSSQAATTQAFSSVAAGPRTYKISNPPQYEESLALYRQSFTSAFASLMQSNSVSATSRLEEIQQNVTKKRSLNIFRQ